MANNQTNKPQQEQQNKKKKGGFALWWHNLGKGGRIAISCLAGAAVVTAVVVPTVIAINKKNNNIDVSIDEIERVDYKNNGFDKDGNLKLYIKGKNGNEIDTLNISIGNYILNSNEYSYDNKTGDLIINKSVLSAHSGKINITPIFKIKTDSIVLDKKSLDIGVGNNRAVQLVATTTPVGAEVTWESSNPNKVSVSSTGLVTALAPTDDDEKVTITAKAGEKTATCDVTSFKFYYIDINKTVIKDGKTLCQLFNDCDHIYFGKEGDVFPSEEGYVSQTFNVEDVGGGSLGGNIKAEYHDFTLKRLGAPSIVIKSEGRIALKDSSVSPFSNLDNTFELDLRGVDFTELTSFEGLFKNSKGLSNIYNIHANNLPNVKNFASMFEGCHNLSYVNLDSLDTSNATNMSKMFKECYSYPIFDLSNLNTSKVTDMSNMFDMTIINDFPHSITKEIYVSDKFDISSVTNDTEMFKNCTYLTGEGGTKCDGINHIGKEYARLDKGQSEPGYFTDISKKPYDIDWETKEFGEEGSKKKLHDIATESTGIEFIKSEDTSGTHCGETLNDKIYFTFNNKVLKIMSKNKIAFNDFDETMFYSCRLLTDFKLDNIDTRKVSNFASAFGSLSNMSELDLSNLDTFNARFMKNMFRQNEAETVGLNKIYVGNNFTNFKAISDIGDKGEDMFSGTSLCGQCSTNMAKNNGIWSKYPGASYYSAAYCACIDGGIYESGTEQENFIKPGMFCDAKNKTYFLEWDSQNNNYRLDIPELKTGKYHFVTKIKDNNRIENFQLENIDGQGQDIEGDFKVFMNSEYNPNNTFYAGGGLIMMMGWPPATQTDHVFGFEITTTSDIQNAVVKCF